MHALKTWNGGVILISHDERFITTVAREVIPGSTAYFLHSLTIEILQLWVCGDGAVSKFMGDVEAYKVCLFQPNFSLPLRFSHLFLLTLELDCKWYKGEAIACVVLLFVQLLVVLEARHAMSPVGLWWQSTGDALTRRSHSHHDGSTRRCSSYPTSIPDETRCLIQ